MPLCEKVFWHNLLKSKQMLGFKFTRQKPIDKYILDFYCSKLLLGIEIDGESHSDQIEYDLIRTIQIESCGIKVLRYTNEEVLTNLRGVEIDLIEKINFRIQEFM